MNNTNTTEAAVANTTARPNYGQVVINGVFKVKTRTDFETKETTETTWEYSKEPPITFGTQRMQNIKQSSRSKYCGTRIPFVVDPQNGLEFDVTLSQWLMPDKIFQVSYKGKNPGEVITRQVPFAQRNKANLKEAMPGFGMFEFGLTRDEEGNIQKRRYLCLFDAYKYLMENLKEDTPIKVTGNYQFQLTDDGNERKTIDVTKIELLPEGKKFGMSVIQDVLLTADSLDFNKEDALETLEVPISARVIKPVSKVQPAFNSDRKEQEMPKGTMHAFNFDFHLNIKPENIDIVEKYVRSSLLKLNDAGAVVVKAQFEVVGGQSTVETGEDSAEINDMLNILDSGDFNDEDFYQTYANTYIVPRFAFRKIQFRNGKPIFIKDGYEAADFNVRAPYQHFSDKDDQYTDEDFDGDGEDFMAGLGGLDASNTIDPVDTHSDMISIEEDDLPF